MLISDSFGKAIFKNTDAKFFIGYKDDEKIRPLFFNLAKMNGCSNSFKETKRKSFEIKENELLERYSKIWLRLTKAWIKKS